MCEMLTELEIDMISVSESIRHSFVSVLPRKLDAFAGDDNEIRHTTQIEHGSQTGKSLPFCEKARPVPYAPHIFIDRDLKRMLHHGIISVGNRG